MMSSPVITVTVQAAGFSIASTLLAQAIAMYQAQKLSWVDPISLLQFMMIAILVTPPNYKFQKFLEDRFPSRPESGTEKAGESGPLSIENTVRKFLLDQSVGAVVNTLMFILLVDVFKGYGAERVVTDVRRVSNTPQILTSGSD